MILVNFPREGKDNILLVNWAAHPSNPYDATIGYKNISADHPGWCRDKLEELIGDGTKIAYFNGASGDVVPNSQIKEINHGLNAKQYGEKLAEIAYSHIGEMKTVEVDAVKSTQKKVNCKVEHEDENLLIQCMEIQQIRYNVDKKTADQMAMDELREKVNRLQLEKQYRQLQAELNPKKKNFLEDYGKKALNDMLVPATINVGKNYLEKVLKKQLGLETKDEIAELEKKVRKLEAERKIKKYEKGGDDVDLDTTIANMQKILDKYDLETLKNISSAKTNVNNILGVKKDKD
jgi:hypothetical protein